MPNIVIGQFRDLLRNYYSKSVALQKEMNDESKHYSDEYRMQALKPYMEKKEVLHHNVIKRISDIYNDTRESLSIANFPDVQDLTSDRLLFADNTGIDLTPNEVQSYVQRYSNNPTMLRLIKSWVTKNHDGFNDYTDVKKSIILPSDQLDVYREFAQSAIDVVSDIYNGNSNVNDAVVNSYADETFGASLFAKVGDGFRLSDYKSKVVPDNARHSFDDVTLHEVTNAGVFPISNNED